jgi:hypothetical protein
MTSQDYLRSASLDGGQHGAGHDAGGAVPNTNWPFDEPWDYNRLPDAVPDRAIAWMKENMK